MTRLIASLEETRDRVGYCSVCGNLTDIEPCEVCRMKSVTLRSYVVGYPKICWLSSGRSTGAYTMFFTGISSPERHWAGRFRIKELMARLEPGKGSRKSYWPPIQM